jgi:hypothetical protein
MFFQVKYILKKHLKIKVIALHYSVFNNAIVVAFQNDFYLKLHQNNIFFKNIYFDINTSK